MKYRITLELTEEELFTLRDALLDKDYTEEHAEIARQIRQSLKAQGVAIKDFRIVPFDDSIPMGKDVRDGYFDLDAETGYWADQEGVDERNRESYKELFGIDPKDLPDYRE